MLEAPFIVLKENSGNGTRAGKCILQATGAGKTELEGYINKPLKIGSDTTSPPD